MSGWDIVLTAFLILAVLYLPFYLILVGVLFVRWIKDARRLKAAQTEETT